MPITVVEGDQRGDEGKGRFVDMLAEFQDIVARFNGGANAGHTVAYGNMLLKLHQLPSGIAYPHTMNVIGNGVLLDAPKLVTEIESVQEQGIEIGEHNLLISSAAHLTFPSHIYEDRIREAGAGRQGTTGSGIAQTAGDKFLRQGWRVEAIENDPDGLKDAVLEALRLQRDERYGAGIEDINEREIADEFIHQARKLGRFSTDTALYLNRQLADGKRLLAEGAQAFLLDPDHGMYPLSTSTHTTTGGVLTGLGVGFKYIEKVIGVAKVIPSHVGDGPFVTEITDRNLRNQLDSAKGSIDAEFGTTTGRERRLGHLDLPVIRRAHMVNGTTEVALTKLDRLSRYGGEIPVCIAYDRKGKEVPVAPDGARKIEQCTPVYTELPGWNEDISAVREFNDLPANAQKYVKFIEEQTGVDVRMIGVGPMREQVIVRS